MSLFIGTLYLSIVSSRSIYQLNITGLCDFFSSLEKYYEHNHQNQEQQIICKAELITEVSFFFFGKESKTKKSKISNGAQTVKSECHFFVLPAHEIHLTISLVKLKHFINIFHHILSMNFVLYLSDKYYSSYIIHSALRIQR